MTRDGPAISGSVNPPGSLRTDGGGTDARSVADTARIDLSDAKSKIAEAKREMESAARWEEDTEQAQIYRHHAEQLGVAMDAVNRYVGTDAAQDGGSR